MSSVGNPPVARAFGVPLLKLGLGLMLLGFLGWRYRAELSALLDRGVRLPWVAVSLLLLLANMLVTFYRWAVMVRATGLHFTYGQAVRYGFLGYISSLLLPSSLGGDVVRSVLVARHQQRRTVAVASVWVDRLVGLLALAWLAGAAGLAAVWAGVAELRGIALWVLGCAVALTGGFVAVLVLPLLGRGRAVAWLGRLPRIGGLVSEVVAAILAYRHRWRSVLVAYGLGMVGHGLFLLAAWSGGLSVWDQRPRLLAHLVVTPIAVLFAVFPLTPGGLGITELAASGLFGLVGEDPAAAVLMMLVSRAVQILILATAGLVLSVDVQGLSASARGGETDTLGVRRSVPGDPADLPDPQSPDHQS